MSDEPNTVDLESKLRRVRYVKYGGMWHGSEGKPAENSLLAFFYDTGFSGCGIFPPLHVLNEYLLHGGNKGGMSPGETWEPFSLSPAEYELLVEAIRAIPPESLNGIAGWVPPQFEFDPEFDGDPKEYPIYPGYKGMPSCIKRWPAGMETYYAWLSAVCAKHRETWRTKWARPEK